jgi:hypothetical protein
MQPLVGTNMPRNLPASIGCQACNTSMAAPKACGLSTSRGMTFSSYVGSAASLQPRKQSLHARHQRQRLASSHAAVLCTLRNFDWPEVLLARWILFVVVNLSGLVVATISHAHERRCHASSELRMRVLPPRAWQLRVSHGSA